MDICNNNNSTDAKNIFLRQGIKNIAHISDKQMIEKGHQVHGNETFLDPDGRKFEILYITNNNATNAVAYCVSNPWGSNCNNRRSADTDYYTTHIDKDGFLCLADDACKEVYESPYNLEFAILRARFWVVAFSYYMENGCFPGVEE